MKELYKLSGDTKEKKGKQETVNLGVTIYAVAVSLEDALAQVVTFATNVTFIGTQKLGSGWR